jgi:hypothetical protein
MRKLQFEFHCARWLMCFWLAGLEKHYQAFKKKGYTENTIETLQLSGALRISLIGLPAHSTSVLCRV